MYVRKTNSNVSNVTNTLHNNESIPKSSFCFEERRAKKKKQSNAIHIRFAHEHEHVTHTLQICREKKKRIEPIIIAASMLCFDFSTEMTILRN